MVDAATNITGISREIAGRADDGVMPMFSDRRRFDPKAPAILGRSFVSMKLLPTEPDMTKLYTEGFFRPPCDRAGIPDPHFKRGRGKGPVDDESGRLKGDPRGEPLDLRPCGTSERECGRNEQLFHWNPPRDIALLMGIAQECFEILAVGGKPVHKRIRAVSGQLILEVEHRIDQR